MFFLQYFLQVLLLPSVLLLASLFARLLWFVYIEGVGWIEGLFWCLNSSAFAAGVKFSSTKLLSLFFVIAQWIMGIWIAEKVIMTFIKGHGWGILRQMRNEAKIKRMKDHIIICGYGQMGRALAEECQRAKALFLVIEKQESLAKQLLQDGIPTVFGDAKRRGILLSSGIKKAKAIFILIDDDAENLYITVTAKSLNPSLFIITRAGKVRYAHVLRSAGANYVIVPEEVAAKHAWNTLVEKIHEGSNS